MNLYLTDPYYFSTAIASVVLVSQVLSVLTVLALIIPSSASKRYLHALRKHSLGLALTVTFIAVLSSLTYSDYFQMAPCKLCWYQRIFIFPQLIILAVAFWRKHASEFEDYCIALACIAIPISVFHYLLQMTDAPAVHSFAPCDVTGQAPSCSGFYVIMYNYITIPMMAMTTSVLVLLLMILQKRSFK